MLKFSSIRFLIIVLLSVLLLSLCGSFSEGFTKSSSVLNMQSTYVNKALSDYKTKPMPPDSPPGTKEFIDKNLVYLEAFAKGLNDLILELSTTMDTTKVPIAKISELITKYKAEIATEGVVAGKTITKITPDIGLLMAIGFDLTGIEQLTNDAPKSIFDKYINYRVDLMNGLFSSSNIDEMLTLATLANASTPQPVVIDKVKMKNTITTYLVDFKQLQNSPPVYSAPKFYVPKFYAPITSAPITSAPITSAPITSAPITSAPNALQAPTEIPILQQNQSSYTSMFNWSFF